MSEDKKKASSKAKTAEEKKKEEVLENIMEELEEEAKEKETAQTPDTQEEKDDAEKEATVEKEKNKKEKKNPLQEKIDELNDKVLRQMAEFENFRKRTDKEKSQQFELGQGNVLEKLLPVVDNFERGLAAVPEAEKDGAFADGMNKIYKQLIKQLEDLGVTPIEAVGKEFDPNLHNAVMQVESQEYESGIVAQELQKGYMFHDTVLRHSMVAVAQ
ncbi:nucleotide exchange factor GrpE [Butyrivibrio sp. NC2007]|uniref:nucleotide exchange factor GrpE n=1 Tax=Butyrivibrio sp. NC2007 TaxID=1280683 RepID=UPI0003B56AD0|nr:nucleotide exchange factor GrpE [Butyrivibrio sp. NC2007]